MEETGTNENKTIPFLKVTFVEKSEKDDNSEEENSNDILNQIKNNYANEEEEILFISNFRFNSSHLKEDRESIVRKLAEESFGIPSEKILTYTSCDICEKRLKNEENFMSDICKNCDKIYDYCISHPKPENCPFCKK